jgi:hypothetical protein
MSTACHLAMRSATKKLRVAVVEKDRTYRSASKDAIKTVPLHMIENHRDHLYTLPVTIILFIQACKCHAECRRSTTTGLLHLSTRTPTHARSSLRHSPGDRVEGCNGLVARFSSTAPAQTHRHNDTRKRFQFSLEQNVRMSLYGLDFMRQMREWPSSDDVQFVQQGYVFMASTDTGAQVLRENHTVQTQAGADIQLLDAAELGAKFPWMTTNDIKLATFGRSGEGWYECGRVNKRVAHFI